MKLVKRDYLYFFLLFIISLIFISDLFFHSGKPETFDAATHATTIAQFYLAIKSGNFPVVWLGAFANYGLPIGIVAHQLTNYLGALINFITQDPLTSLNIVAFLGIFLSNSFFYLFLRLYFTPDIAFVSSFFFNFSSYRITNFYIRGAVPELFSNMFLPLILIAIWLFVSKRNSKSILLFIVSLAGLSLNHPMMLLIYSFVFIPYVFFLLFVDKSTKKDDAQDKVKSLVVIGIAAVIGIGIASYYLVPLFVESKYFYFGLSDNLLAANSFLTLKNYIDASWFHFDPSEIYSRGGSITVGVLNTVVVLVGTVYFFYQLIRKKATKLFSLLAFSLIMSYVLIFFTLPLSHIFYTSINLLSNIQFPWRMLSSFIFLPPIILGVLLTRWQNKVLFILIIAAVSIMSFSQLFGKDYRVVTPQEYYFTKYNLHSVMMNTIWTGKTEDYPVKSQKPDIIEGTGHITIQNVSNTERKYIVNAKTKLRMVDYTFYFPGWKIFADNKEVPIEFQDPKYRGVITYTLDPGVHSVLLVFTATKVRVLGEVLSVVFVLSSLFFLFLVKKIRLLSYS